MIKFLLTAFATLVIITCCFGQTRKVKGKVVSNFGESVPGVNVIVKGTTIGTSTDVNGEFTIDVPDNERVILLFSFGSAIEKEISKNQNYIKLKLTLAESYHAIYAMAGVNIDITYDDIGLNYAVGYRYLYYRFGLGAEFQYIQSNKSDSNVSEFDHLGLPIIGYFRFPGSHFTTSIGSGYYWGIERGSGNNDTKLLMGLSYERNRFALECRYLNGLTRISDEVNEKRKNLSFGVRFRFH